MKYKCCGNCKHGVAYGESVEYIKCAISVRKMTVKKNDICRHHEKVEEVQG